MLNKFFGTKIKQTRIFTPQGVEIPVTEINTSPLTVCQIKDIAQDGYTAIQFGVLTQSKVKSITKPEQGHIKKAGITNFPRFLREIRLHEENTLKIGDQVKVNDVFAVGDKIKVSGITKAKGFQGGVKRHGFKGGPRTHGQSDRERAPGAIGMTTTPGRVFKGKHMAGHMGGKALTIRGLTIIAIDNDKNMMQVKGLIPGKTGELVTITKM